jgi:hypothetical protein
MRIIHQVRVSLVLLILTQVSQSSQVDDIFANGFESLPPNFVMSGLWAGSNIQAFSLEDLNQPIETTTSNEGGEFILTLNGQSNHDWILITATGGLDHDFDQNGIIDANPTPVLGSVSAIAKVGDLRAGGLTINLISDLVWFYSKSITGLVSPEELHIRVNEVTQQFVLNDINDDLVTNWLDAVSFYPGNENHRGALNFDFNTLLNPYEEWDSYSTAIINHDEGLLATFHEDFFSHVLSDGPVPDERYNSAKVSLQVFGNGTAATLDGHTLIVNTLTGSHKAQAFVSNDSNTSWTFMAIPAEGYHFVEWLGCDSQSIPDRTCTIDIDQSHDVVANFAANEVILKGNVIDVSTATNTLSPQAIDVIIPQDQIDLVTNMSSLKAGDFIVGSTGLGFLRKVVTVGQITPHRYLVETESANLEDVIENGTGLLYKELTNNSLAGYTIDSSGMAKIASDAFDGIDQVDLLPSNDPYNPYFTLQFGSSSRNANQGQSIEDEITLVKTNAGELKAKGKLQIKISFDNGFDYRIGSGLESFKLITQIQAKENFEVNFTGTLGKFKGEKRLGTIKFKRLKFFIGPVPVWIKPEIDVFLAYNGKLGAATTFGFGGEQAIRAGVSYHKADGFDPVGSYNQKWAPNYPEFKATAYTQFGLRAKTETLIYDATGPEVTLDGFIAGSSNTAIGGEGWINEGCIGSYSKSSLFWGVKSVFKWKTGLGDTKIGKFLHLDDLEEATKFTILNFKWPIRKFDIEGDCPPAPPHLHVFGDPIIEEFVTGSGGVSDFQTEVTLTNNGFENLPWGALYGDDAHTTVSPSSGTLAPGEIIKVQVSVSALGLSVGKYRNNITFENQFDSELTSVEGGSTQVPIQIDVKPAVMNKPVIQDVTRPAPGAAEVSWTFEAGEDNHAYTKFYVYSSTDPKEPEKWLLRAILPIESTQTRMEGFIGGTRVYFTVQPIADTIAGIPSDAQWVLIDGLNMPPAEFPLNDTVTRFSANYPSGNDSNCSVQNGQDCNHGRDHDNLDESNGAAGFNYTKLDINGNELPDESTEWSCVRDNVTGLVWEVKTIGGFDSPDVHANERTSYWGGITSLGDGTLGQYYDSQHPDVTIEPDGEDSWDPIVNDSNESLFCGFNDWRLPSPKELLSIVDYSRMNEPGEVPISATIDTKYFPNTPVFFGVVYWTNTPETMQAEEIIDPNAEGRAHVVNFINGATYSLKRDNFGYVRLVRSP